MAPWPLCARAFPSVTVLELPQNRGFGAAVNAGAALSDGEAIVLVNDDVEVEQGFVEAIVEPLRADPGCAMVAGMTLIPGTRPGRCVRDRARRNAGRV